MTRLLMIWKKTILFQDSVIISVLRQSLVQAQRDFLHANTTILKKENELEKQRFLVFVLLSFFVLGIIVFLFLRKKASFDLRIEELSALHRASQKMLDMQNVETVNANAQLAQREEALLSLRKQFAFMYKAQYKTLNDLCAAYLSPVRKERKDVIYDEVMHQVGMIVNGKGTQDKFISLVNDSLDNIIEKLREDLPKHKDQDFSFLTYIIVGMDQIDNTSTLSDWFYASICKMNFNNTGEVEKVLLDWINSKSEVLKLEKSPVEVKVSDRKVLCNVTNFHGKWHVHFDKEETQKADFTSWDKVVKDIDMMQSKSAYFPCYEGDGVKSVEIAYGKKDEYLMTVIMSDSEKLSYDDFKNLRSKEKAGNLKVHFPKFSVEVNDLKLESYCADIPECVQIAKIIVDEEGSKATAVTNIIETDPQTEPARDFFINKSFHFVISEREIGLILFIGRYY